MNNKTVEDARSATQSMTAGAFTATLKGKINGLEETIKALQEELIFYKKEIQVLRSEKEQLDDSVTRKA